MLVSLEEEEEGILQSIIRNIFYIIFKFMICVKNFAVIRSKLT